MLPFMKEQSGEVPADQEVSADGSQSGHASEYYTVSGQDKKVRNGTLFLFVLFGLGLVALYFMTQKSKLKSASASTEISEDAKIEVAISRLTGVSTDMMDRMDKIVNSFYEFSDVPQVGVEELRKNPFELENYATQANDDLEADKDKAVHDAKEIAYQKMMKEFAILSLISIMKTDVGARCVLNDSVRFEGDWVDHFQINTIAETSVELHWKPSDVDLTTIPLENRTIAMNLSE
jgi:hypothetical protein